MKSSDLGVIAHTDGASGATRPQTTYEGLPRHYYAPATRNTVEGDGIGNVW